MFFFPIIHLIAVYGYAVILIGSFFEGETILIIGGLAVEQGYLNLPLVFLCSFIGTICSDNLFFFLGRRYGRRLVGRFTFFKNFTAVSGKLSGKSGPFLSFAMRFMYGFRHLVPVNLGMSEIKTRTFFFFNLLGGITWVVTIGLLGYFFGGFLEILLGRIKHYEFRAVVVIIVVAVLGNIAYKIIRYGIKGFLKRP